MSKRRDTPPSPFRIVVTRQGVATIEQHMDTMCYVPHVVLSAEQWGAIAASIQAVITAQRNKYGQRRGKWTSPIPLDRQEGKEVLVLAYGIERADVALIRRAIVNWKGLHPEERWWLCTQTMAVRDHPDYGPDRGWRKALRFILTENPTSID